MTGGGELPVPPGFDLLRDCYRDSMRAAGIDAELAALHRDAVADGSDTTRPSEMCQQLQGLVHKAGVSDSVRDDHRCQRRRGYASSTVTAPR
ncbi:hypothetical protein ABGB19_01395 [Mycobacterium sp. B14F4]|uniref:hypothetical protein n=1 Tax=Mycobacterium sp. B14F4 TaxID=3153565 RepID=UPI00325E441E